MGPFFLAQVTLVLALQSTATAQATPAAAEPVASEPPATEPAPLEPPARAPTETMALSLDVHGGFFGLFNIERNYTDADPAFGMTLAFEADVHRYLALGVEYGLSWARSVRAEHYHLTMAPQLRARFNVDLEAGFSFYLIAATGLSIWPEDDAEVALDPRLRFTRIGWSLRVTGGLEYAFAASPWRFFFGLGYAASSTYNDELDATIDNMLVIAGTRFRF